MLKHTVETLLFYDAGNLKKVNAMSDIIKEMPPKTLYHIQKIANTISCNPESVYASSMSGYTCLFPHLDKAINQILGRRAMSLASA